MPLLPHRAVAVWTENGAMDKGELPHLEGQVTPSIPAPTWAAPQFSRTGGFSEVVTYQKL